MIGGLKLYESKLFAEHYRFGQVKWHENWVDQGEMREIA